MRAREYLRDPFLSTCGPPSEPQNLLYNPMEYRLSYKKKKDRDRVSHVFDLHKILVDNVKYEGEAIWSRFKILLTTNLALFVSVYFVNKDTPSLGRSIVLGLLISTGLVYS